MRQARPAESASPSPTRLVGAWCVHGLTASGAVWGGLALWEIGRGGFERAAIYMLVALAIDSVDGTLARRVGVAWVVPRIDGRRLDDVVDFLNFAVVPVVFLLALGSFTHWSLAILPLLASCYGFAQTHAKTPDDFFLGWPSYWNVVALYVWKLDLSPEAATAWTTLFSVMILVPLKYLYPSRMHRWQLATNLGAFLWIWTMAFCVWFPEATARIHLVEISLAYPAYYVAVSAWLGEWFRSGAGAPA